MKDRTGNHVINSIKAGFVTACGVVVFLSVAGGFAAISQERLAKEEWWKRTREVAAGRYVLRCDLSRDEAGLVVGELNDTLRRGYEVVCGTLDSREQWPLLVWGFESRFDMMDAARTRQGADVSNDVGRFVRGTSNKLIVICGENQPQSMVRRVLRHEGFHQYAQKVFGGDLPWWLEEGLAELFERAATVDGKAMFGEISADDLQPMQIAVDQKKTTSLAALMNLTEGEFKSSDSDTRDILLGQAWLMAMWLANDPSGQRLELLRGFLKNINVGMGREEATHRAFGDQTEAMDSAWRTWVLELQPSALATAADRMEFLAQGATALAQSGTLAASLEDLRSKLVASDFSITEHVHAQVRIHSAKDGSMFELPVVVGSDARPEFVVERPNMAGRPKREQIEEQKHPTPAVIRTQGLGGRELRVEWKWDEKEQGWHWGIKSVDAH
ncbi:MAG TPA: DUF1570 domain-containing protein [Phycisphaerales bacterium]|nr:DUF1570 domain-containing protein [Phycisphaerales bacterium]